MMLKLRSCPKCRGDIRIDKDMYGWYEECIQCGYLGYMEDMLDGKVYQTEQTRDSTLCCDESVLWWDDGHGKLALALS